jgi:hypothetical protein
MEGDTYYLSQAGQDCFVLWVQDAFKENTDSKQSRTYLEIGAGHPHTNSNSFVLEQAGWKGISLDINQGLVRLWTLYRKNLCMTTDTTKLDFKTFWSSFFPSSPHQIDYLSFDVDEGTPATVKNFPWDTIRFKVMTFEHDMYKNGDGLAEEARTLLTSYGYVLVCKNIKVMDKRFEDWWVDPCLVDMTKIQPIITLTEEGIDGWTHVMKNIIAPRSKTHRQKDTQTNE